MPLRQIKIFNVMVYSYRIFLEFTNATATKKEFKCDSLCLPRLASQKEEEEVAVSFFGTFPKGEWRSQSPVAIISNNCLHLLSLSFFFIRHHISSILSNYFCLPLFQKSYLSLSLSFSKESLSLFYCHYCSSLFSLLHLSLKITLSINPYLFLSLSLLLPSLRFNLSLLTYLCLLYFGSISFEGFHPSLPLFLTLYEPIQLSLSHRVHRYISLSHTFPSRSTSSSKCLSLSHTQLHYSSSVTFYLYIQRTF